MEQLLDAADALAPSNFGCPSRPNFIIPPEIDVSTERTAELLMLVDDPNPKKGKGYYACQNIGAGTTVMVAKPISMVLDWQDFGPSADDMEDDENEEPKLNLLILLQLLSDIAKNPSLWFDVLTTLFPRSEADLGSLPAWVCGDDDAFLQVEKLLDQLRKIPDLDDTVNEIAKRLPLIVRYNVLSVETCPELLSYPGQGGHAPIGGVGLYHMPSFFNHSARPNVSRYAVGDVMFFVANQDIAKGTEVCISYCEHDILCESAFRRNLMLLMNFEDTTEDENVDAYEEEGPQLPVVDSEVQNELMAMDPFERLTSIDELLSQATGEALPPEEENTNLSEEAMDTEGGAWFQCDQQNLRILKAITLDGLGQSMEALALWEECIVFAETKLPPLDESSVVVRVQAALSSLHCGDTERAMQHAQAALTIHDKLFHGGLALFRRRYKNDFKLNLRPEIEGQNGRNDEDVLWPMPR